MAGWRRAVVAILVAPLLVLVGAGPATADPTWLPAASVAGARYGHASVTLANGKVLVVGGRATSGFVDSAELYDPASGTWSSAGKPGVGVYPTATLLAGGKVLIAGGGHQNGPCPQANCVDNAALLYDPATNSFSPTASMNERRLGHTATSLADGRVLVAGGDPNELRVNDSAELYNPTSNTWSGTGTMSQPRAFHTATVLPNNKVLVAGGNDANFVAGTSTAELFDPALGTWSAAPSMSAGRSGATATRLPSGKVLVAGGADGSGQAVAGAELYDGATNAWSPAGSLAAGRFSHTATLLLDGRVLVAGGGTSAASTVTLSSAELYDPASNAWTATAAMTAERKVHTASLLADGDVLVAGGIGACTALASAERFTGAGTPPPPPPGPCEAAVDAARARIEAQLAALRARASQLPPSAAVPALRALDQAQAQIEAQLTAACPR